MVKYNSYGVISADIVVAVVVVDVVHLHQTTTTTLTVCLTPHHPSLPPLLSHKKQSQYLENNCLQRFSQKDSSWSNFGSVGIGHVSD